MRSDFCKKVAANDMPSAATCLSHMKKILSVFQRRVEPSHPRKRLVASRSVASAFTSEQQRRSATFFGKEEQRRERADSFCKKVAASDMQLILGVPAKPPALRGKEEQRRERARIFVKKSEQAIQSLLRRGGAGGIRTHEPVRTT